MTSNFVFPQDTPDGKAGLARAGGLELRDYFAAQVQADDRLVKCVRAMDDTALEIFALHPTCEREEHLTEVDLTCWAALPSEVAKVRRRLELEARAIARVRYMQADAMLAERAKQAPDVRTMRRSEQHLTDVWHAHTKGKGYLGLLYFEVGADLFKEYHDGLLTLYRDAPTPPGPQQLAFRSARLRSSGKPGWKVAIVDAWD